MTPTPRLRFIERLKITHIDNAGNSTGMAIRILQQWWEDKNIVLSIHVEDRDGNPMPSPIRGEWRDVPLEKEND